MGMILPLSYELKKIGKANRRPSSIIKILLVLVFLYLYKSSQAREFAAKRIRNGLKPLLTRQNVNGNLTLEPIDFCQLDLDRLSTYRLTSRFEYSQRYVQQMPLSKERQAELTDGQNPPELLSGELFPTVSTVDYDKAERVNGTLSTPIAACSKDIVPLQVKHEEDVAGVGDADDLSHLLFGVASTAERLLEAKDHFGFWLGHTGAQILIAVPDSPFIPLLRYEFEQRGVQLRIIVSDLDFLKMYFKLVVWLDEFKSSNTQWVTIIDDDTVYFSLRRFSKMLAKYDQSKDWYIGAPSEDSWQMMRSGFFGFGGAGITLSVPLLTRILPFYDECLTYEKIEINDPELGGDLRLARCITRNTETRFTIETDLHQVDLRGDVRGVLQGPMWGGLDILRFADSTPFCQADCLFQRWKFTSLNSEGASDERPSKNVSVLHLGHSFVRYADGIDPELKRYELTWVRKPLSIYDHSFEPLRRSYVEGKERHSYLFEGGYWADDGSYIQTYIKRAIPLSGGLDSVVELIWR